MCADARKDGFRLWPPTPGGIRSDQEGDGRFGSPRGVRKHRGLDFLAQVNALVFAPCAGTVGEHGYCYPDDLAYRYVRIHTDWAEVRVLYIVPKVQPGTVVSPGQVIGQAQDVTKRYSPLVLNHVHLEVRPIHGVLLGTEGRYPGDVVSVNPEWFLQEV